MKLGVRAHLLKTHLDEELLQAPSRDPPRCNRPNGAVAGESSCLNPFCSHQRAAIDDVSHVEMGPTQVYRFIASEKGEAKLEIPHRGSNPTFTLTIPVSAP